MYKHIRQTILFIVTFTGVFLTASGFMYMILEPNDHWLWFSRLSVGAILLGILALILKEK